MQDKKYNDAKKEIRSVLLTYQKPVGLQEFVRTYHSLLGQRLPSKALGFYSDVVFLQSMPDVVSVCTDSCGKIQLSGIADVKSQHIQKLVSRQRNNKPNNSKRQPIRRPPSNPFLNAREQTPFLPGPLRAEILQLMTMYQSGVSFPAFVISYRRKFNKCLSLARGLETLEAMIKLIPQLEVRIEAKEKRIHNKHFQSNQYKEANRDKNNSSASEMTDEAERQAKICINIHKSGISDDVLQNFLLLLKKCPEGIQDIHFPPLYENLTGKSFDLHELGYNSMVDLVDALPHIFKRVLNPIDDKNWIILPADSPIRHRLKIDSFISNHRNQSPVKSGGIPANSASPVLQYIQPIIPEKLDLTNYVPVFVSAIKDPSLFWFQIQTEEAANSFQKFEKDMGNFYNSFADKYKMNGSDIAIGATCIILCPEDNEWYRAKIKSIPSVDLVNISYVDYGSRENIPRANLYYVKSKYHDYPACAFKACLDGVKPSHNTSVWNTSAEQRFVQLCSSGNLMAHLNSCEKDTYSVYLCDTNGETDIHLIDTLVNEGLAEFSCENQHYIHNDRLENHTGETDSGGEFSSRSEEDALQSVKKDSVFQSEILPINRKLSFSTPEMQCNGIKPDISCSRKVQNSKRYVNLLELSEETKIHIINLENKLYMSCADIAKLIFGDRNSNFLIERVMFGFLYFLCLIRF